MVTSLTKNADREESSDVSSSVIESSQSLSIQQQSQANKLQGVKEGEPTPKRPHIRLSGFSKWKKDRVVRNKNQRHNMPRSGSLNSIFNQSRKS